MPSGTPINHLVFTCQWNGEVKGAVCPVKIEGLLVEGTTAHFELEISIEIFIEPTYQNHHFRAQF